MSKKLFNLITAIIGACGAAATAIVAYVDPSYTPAIVGGIGIGVTAVNEILSLFIKKD